MVNVHLILNGHPRWPSKHKKAFSTILPINNFISCIKEGSATQKLVNATLLPLDKSHKLIWYPRGLPSLNTKLK